MFIGAFQRNANLKASLVKALKEQKIPEAKITQATLLFDPTSTISEYISTSTNIHIIKGKGFSSLLSLQTALEEHRTANPSGRAAKSLILPQNANVILSNVVANDFLLSDVPKEKFFNKLRGFVAAAGPHQSAKSGSLSVMDKIRSAALYNARLAIAAENNKENITMSLHELSKQTDADCQKRNIPAQIIGNREFDKIIGSNIKTHQGIALVTHKLKQPDLFSLPLTKSNTIVLLDVLGFYKSL